MASSSKKSTQESAQSEPLADDLADLQSFDIRELEAAAVDSPIIEPGDDLPGDPGDDLPGDPGDDPGAELMDAAEFAEVACFALALPGSFIPRLAPLAIQEHEQPVADEGFAAVHRLIMKTPSLHFMLSAPAGWMGDAMALFALGGLLMGKGAAIRAAGRAEKAAANQDKNPNDPQPEQAAPAVEDEEDGQEVGKA